MSSWPTRSSPTRRGRCWRRELDTQQLMDLVFTVGCYDLIAMFFKSAGVQVDDDLTRYLQK